MNEWIDVKDRLPEKDAQVLGFGKYSNGDHYTAIFAFDGKFYDDYDNDADVKFWMPLPPSP